ncbi:MAG: glucosamine-6-phosphate deaminase [Bacteroidia bacterium]|nr:glucosamine-6-phosphate deaminase [Bacteroidia bacterium]
MNKQMKIDQLKLEIYPDSIQLGKAAAQFVTKHLKEAIDTQGKARMILATGTSQFTFLEALKKENLDWSKVSVFHLDEYIGLPPTHPASFRKYLKERILDELKPGQVHFLAGDAEDIDKEMGRYSSLLKTQPVDIACIGIGENGHLAFNDPPVADFEDPLTVKIVELDEDCRKQQFGEGWFPSLDKVPRTALTLTIPAIMSARIISCVVPEARKARAVKNSLYNEIETSCPASILRRHPHASLFLDEESSAELLA